MSLQAKKTQELARQIARLRAEESATQGAWARRVLWLRRWALMLYHEILRDNLKIRAESLAYLSLFSLLPLLAGCFFIFTVLAQFGMVQDALQNLLANFLGNIPEEHRAFVHEYVLKFQQSYLTTLQQKSGTIGVFALLVLAYVGLQTFSNVDHTLNAVWGADTQRPFLEKIRNFLVFAVVAPITLIAAYSVPLILDRVPVTKFLLDSLPWMKVMLNTLLPVTLLFGFFYVAYRYMPVVRVSWKAALAGALFSTVSFEVTNIFLKLYFSFFTNTAYGKAASVPLIAFWLFVIWGVVILGAEVSFLYENQSDLVADIDESPTFAEARGLVAVLVTLHASYAQGKGSVAWETLLEKASVGAASLRRILEFLIRENHVAEVFAASESHDVHCYLPARDLSKLAAGEVLSDFLKKEEVLDKSEWNKQWKQSFQEWLSSLGELSVGDLVGRNPSSNPKQK